MWAAINGRKIRRFLSHWCGRMAARTARNFETCELGACMLGEECSDGFMALATRYDLRLQGNAPAA